ncbi:hypothetical protein CGC49_09740 [Capnocytophaga sp. H4358]|uniref:hypothetical protein n=1 Tax=Capnocytophaga sp. H4358 TaxID=1945658 RepID=UPI000BB1C9D2|nr:hypothetical protein [Capnocytophaga sp. H4358]ATA73536.1 hypothetical protein CGC49_09740 [Capnocytophaga sp. H4358]
MKKFYFLFALLGVFACSEDEHMTADYFKAQQRDSRFFGKWMAVNPNTLEEEITTFYSEYTEEGEFHLIYRDTGEKNNRVEYYYTKENAIYLLNPGAGFKVSASVSEYKYKFSDDSNILIIQTLEEYRKGDKGEFFKRK